MINQYAQVTVTIRKPVILAKRTHKILDRMTLMPYRIYKFTRAEYIEMKPQFDEGVKTNMLEVKILKRPLKVLAERLKDES